MKAKDTIDKAYGNVPKEVNTSLDFADILPRGVRYYWLRFVRLVTR
jgi:hypothetical protein